MAKQTAAQMKAAADALLTDSGPDWGIDPSEHKTLYENLVDSSLRDASKAGDTVTITLADGTTITFREYSAARPSDAQYYALVTNGTTRPTAAQMTSGADHRASNDGQIAGWPTRQANGYLWLWSSHALTDVRNGDGGRNQFSEMLAPVALTINGTAGQLYRSRTILYPAALNLDWRVS